MSEEKHYWRNYWDNCHSIIQISEGIWSGGNWQSAFWTSDWTNLKTDGWQIHFSWSKYHWVWWQIHSSWSKYIWFGRIIQSAAFPPSLRRDWSSATGRGIHKPLLLIALETFSWIWHYLFEYQVLSIYVYLQWDVSYINLFYWLLWTP